jgi:hypothetical protein
MRKRMSVSLKIFKLVQLIWMDVFNALTRKDGNFFLKLFKLIYRSLFQPIPSYNYSSLPLVKLNIHMLETNLIVYGRRIALCIQFQWVFLILMGFMNTNWIVSVLSIFYGMVSILTYIYYKNDLKKLRQLTLETIPWWQVIEYGGDK